MGGWGAVAEKRKFPLGLADQWALAAYEDHISCSFLKQPVGSVGVRCSVCLVTGL